MTDQRAAALVMQQRTNHAPKLLRLLHFIRLSWRNMDVTKLNLVSTPLQRTQITQYQAIWGAWPTANGHTH